MLVPIKIPPGLYRTGTHYLGKNRWTDGNLIRWDIPSGALVPVGGWARRALSTGAEMPQIVVDPATETIRDMISYRENDGSLGSILGSNQKLYYLPPGNIIDDVTPIGFVGASNKETNLFGYGLGPYGTYTYGTPRNQAFAEIAPVKRWWMDMWGEDVLAAHENNGPIYTFSPNDTEFSTLANAPTDVKGLIVTAQRIVMAIKNGAGGIRQVIWSDRENNTVWTPTQTNYAGSQILSGTGNLIGLYKVGPEVLILSETDAHVANYVGAPFVYGFREVGQNCAPISGKAVMTTDRFAMWLGSRNFWMYDGVLRPVPCDVMGYFQDIKSKSQDSKIHCFTMSEHHEIWWMFQSVDSDDVDRYINYNYLSKIWSMGILSRTVGEDKGANYNPVMIDTDGYMYNHELKGVRPSGVDAYAISGPLELGNGDVNMAIKRVIMDNDSFGDVRISFKTRQMPNDTQVDHGPYYFDNPIKTTGVKGREIRLVIQPEKSRWSVGLLRFDVQKLGSGQR